MNPRSPKSESAQAKLNKANIKSLYPLQPVQEAFLWQQSQQSRTGSDPGVIQASCKITTKSDVSVGESHFRQAWQAVVNQYEMLRASVHSKPGKRSMLIVWKEVEAPLEFHDLTDLESEAKNRQLDLGHSPVEPLDLSKPGAMKLQVWQVTPHEFRVIWNLHHLFLDGWSTFKVLDLLANELSKRVSVGSGSASILPSYDYGDFLKWKSEIESSEAIRFWQRHLSGFRGLPRILGNRREEDVGSQSKILTLSENASREFAAVIREHQLTVSSVVAAVWGLVLSAIYGVDDVAFGMTVSGRSASFGGAENVVGLLSNVVPNRMQITDAPVLDWLVEQRDQQFDVSDFDQTSLAEIESAIKLQPQNVLLESLLVLENFPSESSEPSNVYVSEFKSELTSTYPLTFCVIPGEQWQLKLQWDETKIPSLAAERILDSCAELLPQILNGSSHAVSKIRAGISQFEGVELAQPAETIEVADLASEAMVSDTELQLVMIWEQVLGVAPIGTKDNFFELGGKSVTAVRIMAKIEQVFGRIYSPAAIVEFPTVGELAKLVSEGKEPESSSLVTFNSGGDKVPLVCVHVGGEHALYFRFLAKHFPDHPVVGLQPRGLDGETPFESFEKLATFYNELVEGKFGDQTVHLVGYCAGASLATEMLHQRQARNLSTGKIFVVDTASKWFPMAYSISEFRSRVKVTNPVNVWRLYLQKRLKRYRDNVAERKLMNRLLNSSSEEDRRNGFRLRVGRISDAAFLRYELKRVDTPIHLIRSSEFANESKNDFHLNWEQLTDEFSVEVIESEHQKILLEPNVSKVADWLRKLL